MSRPSPKYLLGEKSIITSWSPCIKKVLVLKKGCYFLDHQKIDLLISLLRGVFFVLCTTYKGQKSYFLHKKSIGVRSQVSTFNITFFLN